MSMCVIYHGLKEMNFKVCDRLLLLSCYDVVVGSLYGVNPSELYLNAGDKWLWLFVALWENTLFN